jgi:hypothetical protein
MSGVYTLHRTGIPLFIPHLSARSLVPLLPSPSYGENLATLATLATKRLPRKHYIRVATRVAKKPRDASDPEPDSCKSSPLPLPEQGRILASLASLASKRLRVLGLGRDATRDAKTVGTLASLNRAPLAPIPREVDHVGLQSPDLLQSPYP